MTVPKIEPQIPRTVYRVIATRSGAICEGCNE